MRIENLGLKKTYLLQMLYANCQLGSKWHLEKVSKFSLVNLNGFQQNLAPGACLIAQLVKNPPAMWETWVRSLG